MSLTVIGGATATGKSDLAVETAVQLREAGIPVAIVNADAMQLYRGMDIGTAKITPEAQHGVPHHMLDVLDITDEATVAGYRQLARPLIDDLLARGVHPIVVGGSGFYLDALLNDRELPGADPAIRASLERELAADGIAPLLARLRQVDPASDERIDPNNTRRVIRALEVQELTGRPFSAFRVETPQPWHPYRLYVLGAPKPWLDDRIAIRTRQMWQQGFIDEVDGLLRQGLRDAPTASRATGYPQAIAQIDGDLSADSAIAATIEATVRLTKKQRTWFRHHGPSIELEAAAPRNVRRIVDAIVESRLNAEHGAADKEHEA